MRGCVYLGGGAPASRRCSCSRWMIRHWLGRVCCLGYWRIRRKL